MNLFRKNINTKIAALTDVIRKLAPYLPVRRAICISTGSRLWRTYSAVWMFLRPLRRYLLGFYHRIIMKIF